MAEIDIEIAYGTAQKQILYALKVAQGTTAREAVAMCPLSADFPQSQPESAPLGIFGKAVKDDTVLRAGDRIEVYRPLLINPKDARRRRVAEKEQIKSK